ncbi:activator of 90 kDa heat shock protein ATPase homolog 1b isoform X2 [Clupea harengus]|uniref:Activator of 90 kDa heat shock protein ATPase homolog 1b isoform X2 n=1 Tax=Clupea harengus TaxID=7950 RepID=A0A8M1KCG8_CLUHA|nr:activator of 90 kDa heat shock protein ATPase homolog 1b isoform X2 [Clupea harengus]
MTVFSLLTERNATNWSSEKLKELLVGIQVENEHGSCEVTEVSTVEGEASISNRKGKLIFFYEWNLKAKWKGITKTGTKFKGHIEIPNLSDENDMDDLDISATLSKDQPDTELLALMRKEGAERVRTALGSYVSFLKTEFTQGMILPTANGITTQQPSQFKAKVDKTLIGSNCSKPSANTGVKIPTCKFRIRDIFTTSPGELYRVFLNQEMVQAFTHAPAVVEPEKGGKFHMIGGNVLGEFQELVPQQKIIMKWRYNSWPSEHYATITLTFSGREGETELNIECRSVPKSEEERTKEGWHRYYLQGIKQTFGYGTRLY